MPNEPVATGPVTSLSQLRQPGAPEMSMPTVRTGMMDLQGFELMQRVGKALASSSLIPQRFQNNLPNCLIALEMAHRIGASPLMVMQNLYVVYGNPGWSAKFLIATFNQCGRFAAIRYRWVGTKGKDDWGCRAFSKEFSTGEEIQGPLIDIALAKKEGWYGKKDSKWQTIPELMLMYRSAAWMINTHAPEISMGLKTGEEIADVYHAERSPDGEYTVTTDSLRGNGALPGAHVDRETGEIKDMQAGDSASGDTPAGAVAEIKAICAKAAAHGDVAIALTMLDDARDLARGLKDAERMNADLAISEAQEALDAKK
jgi:hypothetical protein